MATDSTYTMFVPQGEFEYLRDRFASTPRFLFRTWTPKTTGSTTSTQVRSQAVEKNERTGDLFRRDVDSAKNMLKGHMLWRELCDDNLTSWTSSIIFALQHGKRKSVVVRKNVKEDASTIRIMILDTYALPREVFLSALDLIRAYDLSSDNKVKEKLHWYYGEYLSQGTMDIPVSASVTATLAQLEGLGLRSLYSPALYRWNNNVLWLAVHDARKEIKNVSEKRKEPTTKEIETAQLIATTITTKKMFRPVIMAMLLAMKPRYRFEPLILRAFESNGWGQLIEQAKLEPYSTVTVDVPEYKQFVELMHLLEAQAQYLRETETTQEMTTDRVSDLTSGMKDLQTS